MSDQPHDAAKKENSRTSVSVAVDIVNALKIAWHEECAAKKKDIPQQEFTDSVLQKYLDSRSVSL